MTTEKIGLSNIMAFLAANGTFAYVHGADAETARDCTERAIGLENDVYSLQPVQLEGSSDPRILIQILDARLSSLWEGSVGQVLTLYGSPPQLVVPFFEELIQQIVANATTELKLPHDSSWADGLLVHEETLLLDVRGTEICIIRYTPPNDFERDENQEDCFHF